MYRSTGAKHPRKDCAKCVKNYSLIIHYARTRKLKLPFTDRFLTSTVVALFQSVLRPFGQSATNETWCTMEPVQNVAGALVRETRDNVDPQLLHLPSHIVQRTLVSKNGYYVFVFN